MKRFGVLALGCFLASAAGTAGATTITFAGSEYDNTANTVTAGPTFNYNQTTGLFRDIFWWGQNYGGASPGTGSPDFINAGNHLVPSGLHATPGGSPKALNFTGNSPAGGQNYMTVYDSTPGDGAATRNLFAANGLHVSTDVLFATKHSVSAGIVMMFSEGQDGLALLIHNGAGTNADHTRVDLIWKAPGEGQQLLSTTEAATDFVATNDTNNSPAGSEHWYRIDMGLAISGDTWTVTGNVFAHSTANDPLSALGVLLATITGSGSIANPDSLACSATPAGNDTCLHLTDPGEIGLMVQANEGLGDKCVLGSPSNPLGCTGADPKVDSVGVSFFDLIIPTPEPATLALFGLGLAGLGVMRRRRIT